MNILIAPDKFKGSLTASEVCNAVEKGIRNYLPTAQIKKLPVADGGEGSLEVLDNTLNFKRIYLTVNDPLLRPVKIYYGIAGKTAYIEMAKASGLQLLSKNERNPMLTTTLGTGEMISDAIGRGVNKIYLFLGGSATNDAGMGIAAALGYDFLDEHNIVLKPIGKNLSKVKLIKRKNASSFNHLKIIVSTDVKNKLFGKTGAAFLYAHQKGASKKEIIRLDDGLKNFAKVIKNNFGLRIEDIKGTGAAGGVLASLIFIAQVKIESGINTILNNLRFNEYLKQTDLIITGEGKLDKQTLDGKVVKGIVDICNRNNKPVAIVCGNLQLNKSALDKLKVVCIKEIKTKEISKEESMRNAYSLLVKRSEELIKQILNNN